MGDVKVRCHKGKHKRMPEVKTAIGLLIVKRQRYTARISMYKMTVAKLGRTTYVTVNNGQFSKCASCTRVVSHKKLFI